MGKTSIVSIKIVSDANTRGFKKAADAAGDMSKRIVASTAKIGAITTAISGGAAVAAGAIGQIAAGAAALGTVVGPAAGAVALGFDGIKEAAEKAQPAFDDLKEAMSKDFADRLESSFKGINGLLEGLTPAMRDVAGSSADLIGGVLDTLADSSSEIEALIRASGDFFDAMAPGLNSFVSGLLSIGPAIEPVADQFGTAFGGVLDTIGERFTALADDGTMTALIDGMSVALDGLSNLLGPLIDMAAQLGVALGPGLGGIFTSLGEIIAAITPAFATMAEVTGTALTEGLSALAPWMGVIADAIGRLVVELGPILPMLVDTLAPVLSQIVIVAGNLLAALLPLVQPIAELAAMIADALTDAIAVVMPLIRDVAALLGDVLAMAIEAVRPLFPVIVDAIRTLALSFDPLIPVVKDVAARLLPMLGDIIQAIAPLLPDLARVIGKLIEALVPIIPPLAEVAEALVPALIEVVNALAPILIHAADIFADLLVQLVPLIDPIAEIAKKLFPALADAVGDVAPLIEGLMNLAGDLGQVFMNILLPAIQSVINFIGAMVDMFIDAIQWAGKLIDKISKIDIPGVDLFGGEYEHIVYGTFHGADDGGLSITNLRLTAHAAGNSQPVQEIHIHVTDSVIGDELTLARTIRRVLESSDGIYNRREVLTV